MTTTPQPAAHSRLLTSAVPVIAVSDSARAEDYYCRILGFQKKSVYRPDISKIDPCYLAIARDDVWLHLESFRPDRAGLTGAFIWVTDVDRLHEELSARGAIVRLPPTDQTWGTRELHISDPDGNVLGFGSKLPTNSA
jgi:uncharacterized glyoxalase superfamily protein PhnB